MSGSLIRRHVKRRKKKKAEHGGELGQILFVLPTQSAPSQPTRDAKTDHQGEPLDGSQVKSFYESVVGLTSDHVDPPTSLSSPQQAVEKTSRKQASPRKLILARPTEASDSVPDSYRLSEPVRPTTEASGSVPEPVQSTCTEASGSVSQPVQSIEASGSVSQSVQSIEASRSVSQPVQSIEASSSVSQSVQSIEASGSVSQPVQSIEASGSVSQPVQPSNKQIRKKRHAETDNTRVPKKRKHRSEIVSSPVKTNESIHSISNVVTNLVANQSGAINIDLTQTTEVYYGGGSGSGGGGRSVFKKEVSSEKNSVLHVQHEQDIKTDSHQTSSDGKRISPKKSKKHKNSESLTLPITDTTDPPSCSSLSETCTSSSPSQNVSSPEAKTRSPKKHTPVRITKDNKSRMINGLLRSCQEGNLAQVRKYLECGVKVNAKDSFGWTALMCAAHAGNKRMVTFLLEQGASVSLCDCTGKTALDIANLTKHHKLTKLLVESSTGIIKQHSKTKSSPRKSSPESQTYYCEVCEDSFMESSRDKHNTSTIHLFNCKSRQPAKGTAYMLPESNKGYQLMVKGGWDGDKGLGPLGQGHKFPVKTVLKRDRQGLGCEVDSKPRVTHFGPRDQQAVKRPSELNTQSREMKSSTLSKKQHLKKEKRQQQMERNFRLQFSME